MGVIPDPGNRAAAPIRIWNVAERRLVRVVPPSPAPFGGEPVFSPDGSSIALGRPGSAPALKGPPSGPPGRPRPQLAVVDVRTGRARVLGTTTCGTGWRSQPFSADGTLLAAGTFCGEVYVWDLATGRPLGRPFSIGGELSQIAFSPDASRLAVGSWNSTITVADTQTGRVVGVLTDHTRGVTGVAYSPDGRYLASSSLDDTVRIWDANTLRLLRILRHPDPVYWVAFTRDGRRVVTVDGAQTLRVWDACSACGDVKALLALARTRVTRELSAQERRTFSTP